MALLSHKKDRGISKLYFHHIDQSVSSNFKLSYNERTLVQSNRRHAVTQLSVGVFI